MRSGLSTIVFSGYLPQAKWVFGQMPTPPTDARRKIINALINGMMKDGNWSGIRLFQMPALAATVGQSLINYRGEPQYHGAITGSVTFTADQGWTGDGSTGFVNTNYTPAASDQNVSYMGVWTRNDVNTNVTDFGNARTRINSRNAGNLTTNLDASTSDTVAVANSIGFTLIARQGSATYTRDRNGADLGDATQASQAPSAFPFFVCARNNAGTADLFSTRQIAATIYGNSPLSLAQRTAIYTRINTALVAVGAA